MKYVLLDANVTAAYYLSRSTKSVKVTRRIENLFNSVRQKQSDIFLYLPNFCVAEVFSVFMKYSFGGKWNRHPKKAGPIDTRIYNSLVKQFQHDIHNGKFIYHYELSRYHVLGINLIAPIDHYYQFSKIKRGRKRGSITPMGTFDHLIISMGIHLAHIHGKDNVVIVSADERLTNILGRCRDGIMPETIKKLKLDKSEEITGKKFSPDIFPQCVNLKTSRDTDMKEVFGQWPLSVANKNFEKIYRYLK